MMAKALNPGNINARLGATLQLIEQATAAGDLSTMANLVELVATYLSVHLSPKEWAHYASLPGFTYGDERTIAQVFHDLNARLRWLLGKAKDHNVFARAEMELGDASSLDEEDLVTA